MSMEFTTVDEMIVEIAKRGDAGMFEGAVVAIREKDDPRVTRLVAGDSETICVLFAHALQRLADGGAEDMLLWIRDEIDDMLREI